jgi:hypothetical protein
MRRRKNCASCVGGRQSLSFSGHPSATHNACRNGAARMARMSSRARAHTVTALIMVLAPAAFINSRVSSMPWQPTSALPDHARRGLLRAEARR